MIYHRFYRHNSFCTVFCVSSFYLSLNIVVLRQFTVTCIESCMSLGRKKSVQDYDCVFGSSTTFQRRKEWICESRCRQVSVRLHMFAGFFALKPFHDYSSCSVCILPQLAFYSQSTVCSLHSLHFTPGPQSAVRNLHFTLTDLKSTTTNGLNFRIIISLMQSWRVRVESKYTHSSYGLIRITTTE